MFDNDLLVPRPLYHQTLVETLNSPSIKVLTGIRRCGKSSILKLFAKQLVEDGLSPNNLLYLKTDYYDVPLGSSEFWLEDTIKEFLDSCNLAMPIYCFFDEIQEIEGWERPIRRLYESKRAQIYITGSNAFSLSSDLATYLSGRYIEIPVYVLSFKEYCDFTKEIKSKDDMSLSDKDTLFDTYLRFGAMPSLFETTDFTQASVFRELSSIKDTVILNDVVRRFRLRDVELLEKLVRYLYTTSGNLFSINKISNALTSIGRKTNSETIESYINALGNAYALYECNQIGLKGKAILQPLRKLYAPDLGLRNLYSLFEINDIGFALENVVYLELLRRGYQVNVGVSDNKEIDFVVSRGSQKLYYQVSNSLLGQETRERELAPLNSVRDSFPKIVLTLDRFSVGTTETGIQIKYLPDWLLESY